MSKKISKTGRAIKYLSKGVYNTAKIKTGGVLKPKYLWLEVTDKCNSKCEYCNIHKKTPIANPLSPAEIKTILSSPLFNEVSYIINSGGEPTVRSDLLKIFLAEHEALPNATLQFSTNALLPDKALTIIKELCSRGIKLEVGISLDGIGEAHDKIRGVKGNFDKSDYLAKKLAEMKITFSLGATLTAKTLKTTSTQKNMQKI